MFGVCAGGESRAMEGASVVSVVSTVVSARAMLLNAECNSGMVGNLGTEQAASLSRSEAA